LACVATKDDVESMAKLAEKEPEHFAAKALTHKLNKLTMSTA